MKTLKRTLCLVLVLCMVVGVLAVSASAKFTDDDTITYKEAVGVMSGLGIIDGITASDGTVAFKPTSAVTRAQMAKLIYAGITGDVTGSSVSVYASSSAFKDVKTTDWYAGYVNYVAQKGIIVGDGKGYFRPNDNVTGYEALVMILRALGYDSAAGGKEITTATNWKTAAADKAQELGMLKNVVSADKNFSNNASRELSCELIYRGFLKEKVTYNKLYGDYISANYLTDYDSDTILGANFNYYGQSAEVQVSGVAYSSTTKKLVATAYSGNIGTALTTGTRYTFVPSDYNAVGNVYKVFYKNDGTVVYAQKLSYDVDVSAYSTYSTTNAKWTALAKTVAISTANVPTTTNNGTLTTATNYAYNAAQKLIVLPAAYVSSTATIDLPVAISISNYTRATVAVTYLPATTLLSAGVKAVLSVNGGTGVEIYNSRTSVDYDANNIDWASLVSNASTTATVYYNYYVLDGMYYLTAIPTVTGTVTLGNTSTDKLTLGGTTYSVVPSAVDISADGVASNSTDADTIISSLNYNSATYKAYLDSNGAIFHIVGTSSVSYGDLVYATKFTEVSTTASSSTVFGSTVATADYYAQIVGTDGTVGAYKITSINGLVPVTTAYYNTLSTSAQAAYVNAAANTYTSGATALDFSGDKADISASYVYAKITGSTVALYTTGKVTSAPTVNSGAISGVGTTFSGTKLGTAYITSATKFVYVSNAGASTASATVITGSHTTAAVTAPYYYVTKTDSQGLTVVDSCYIIGSYTGATSTADYYYVAAYVGFDGATYNYTAYKMGSTTPVTLKLSSALSTLDASLYTVSTTSAGISTLADTSTDLTSQSAQATKSFTLGSTTYITINGTDYVVPSNVAFVNLSSTGYIANLAGFSSTATADILFAFDTSSTGVKTLTSVFVITEHVS